MPLDKSEVAVKTQFSDPVFLSHRQASELVEDRSSETLAANHLSVESFHQLSIQPPAGAMILLCESQLAPGRERPINPTFYLPWRTTRGIRLSVEVKFY